jgi:hypothetical protein
MLWVKDKNMKHKFFMEGLKFKKGISYLELNNNHFFKINKNANVEDAKKLLQVD